MNSPDAKRIRQTLVISTLFFGATNALFLSICAYARMLPGDLGGDTNILPLPMYDFAMRELAARHLPELAPIFCGHDAASFGLGLYYPTTLAGCLTLVPHFWFFLGDLWLHWTLSGVAMTLLLTRYRVGLGAALVAGAVYAYSGPLMGRFHGHWVFIHQFPFLPLMVLLAEEALSPRWLRNTRRYIALGGGVVGLTLMAQHPQFLYYMAIALGGYTLARLALRPRVDVLARVTIRSVGACALGLAMAACVVLPTAMGGGESLRPQLSGYALASCFPLSHAHLWSLACPELFFTEGRYWGNSFPIEAQASLGGVGCWLALAGFVALLAQWGGRGRRRLLLPLIMLALAGVLGFGESMPWFGWLVEHWPGFAMLRSHGRVAYLIVLAIALLSAEGVEGLTRALRSRRRQVAPLTTYAGLALALAASLAWLGYSLGSVGRAVRWMDVHCLMPLWGDAKTWAAPSVVASAVGALSAETMTLCVGATLIALVVAFKQARRSLTWTLFMWIAFCLARSAVANYLIVFSLLAPTPDRLVPPSVDAALRDIAADSERNGRILVATRNEVNLPMLYAGLEAASGLDANVSRRYAAQLNTLQGLHPDVSQVHSRIDAIDVCLLDGLSARYLVVRDGAGPPNRIPPDRLQTIAHENGLALIEYVDAVGPVIVHGDADVSIVEQRPGRWTLEANHVTSATIEIRLAASPHWKASINGLPIAIDADGPWLRLPFGGNGRVILQFVNRWLRWGIALSLAGWLTGGWLLVARTHNDRQRTPVAQATDRRRHRSAPRESHCPSVLTPEK